MDGKGQTAMGSDGVAYARGSGKRAISKRLSQSEGKVPTRGVHSLGRQGWDSVRIMMEIEAGLGLVVGTWTGRQVACPWQNLDAGRGLAP